MKKSFKCDNTLDKKIQKSKRETEDVSSLLCRCHDTDRERARGDPHRLSSKA